MSGVSTVSSRQKQDRKVRRDTTRGWDEVRQVGADGPVIELEIRGACATLWTCRDPEIMLSGPARTGKSLGGLAYIHHHLGELFAGSRALIVRKTRESLTKSGLVTYDRKICHAMDGVYYFGGNKAKPDAYIYPNGSELLVGGLDDINKVLSTEYDLIYVQQAEEVELSDWEALTTRLSNGVIPYQQIIGDCNPSTQQHWILRRAAEGKLTILESKHEDNPFLYDIKRNDWTPAGKSYISKLQNLTGLLKERLYYGKWVSAEGVVYDQFRPTVHVIPSFPIPDDWARFMTIDFGFINPFVVQWWAIDKENRLYLYREYVKTQTIVADHVHEIRRLCGEERYEAIIADHDSEDRATLMREGFSTLPARKKVLEGIQAFARRLIPQEDGRPSIYFFRDALVSRDIHMDDKRAPIGLIEELGAYVWDSNHVKGKAEKDEPLKLNDHSCDAARYAVMYVDKRLPDMTPLDLTGSSMWVGRHDNVESRSSPTHAWS